MGNLYSENKAGGGVKPLNKGFTLVELLVIIAVLGMILLIAMPVVGNVMTSTKNKAYDEQIELIYQAMEYHVTRDNVEWKNAKYEVTLEELSGKGYIKTPIKDPRKSNTNISKDLCIVATKSEDEVVNYSIRDYCERTSVIATVDNITNTSMEVEATVKIYDGEIEEYYFSNDDGKTWSEAQPRNTYEFVGLTRDTEYKIKVKAIDNEGNETLSPTVTAKTKNESIPIEITEVVINNKTSSSMTVIATGEPRDGIKGYYYSKDDGETWSAEQQTNTYTFTELTKNTTYPIKVKVISIYDDESISETVNGRTTGIDPPTYTASTNNWTSGNIVVTVHYPSNKESNWVYEYKKDNGAWTTVTGNSQAVTFTENGYVIARVRDTGNDNNTVTASTFQVTKIDKTGPTIASVVVNATTSSSIKVVASASDLETGIKGYYYSKDNGATWSAMQTTNTYTFTGLTRNTTYPIKVKVANTVNQETISSVVNGTTTNIVVPTYTMNPNPWGIGNATVTITYPTNKEANWVYEYKKDEGSWTTVTGTNQAVVFTANGSVVGRITDGTNMVTASTFQAVKRKPILMRETLDISINDLLLGRTDKDSYLGTPILRNQIETLEIVNHKNVPADAIGSYDVSAAQDGTVMLWYKQGAGSLYKVYIGGEGGIHANPDSRHLFSSLTYLTSINLQYLDTSEVENMSYMFSDTRNLTSLEFGSNFNTSNVTDMGSMFSDMWTLSSLEFGPNFNTSNVTNMLGMFSHMYGLVTIKHTGGRDNVINFDTSNVTNMHSMFRETKLSSLEFGPNFVTSNVTGMGYIFQDMINLTRIKHTGGQDNVINFDTSKVTNMSYMFYNTNLSSLELGSNFVTNNVTNMSNMFAASKLVNLKFGSNFVTSNVTDMSYMFNIFNTGSSLSDTGSNLTTITTPAGVNVINLDTSKVTNMNAMFARSKLANLKFGSNFVTSNVTKMSIMFKDSEIANLEFGPNFVTSNVTDMSAMFSYLHSATVIKHSGGANNVINLDTSKVTNMNAMFAYSKLTSLEFGPNFNTSKVTDVSDMFRNMTVLSSLNIRYFNFSMVNVADARYYRNMFTSTPSTVQITVNSAGSNWLNTYGFSAWNNRVIVP